MENKERALFIICQLKLTRKTLAKTAEYVMSVDTFTYDDICSELNTPKHVAYNRMTLLKKKGFVFERISRTIEDGGTFRLVDCKEWIPKQRICPTLSEEHEVKFVFVDKSYVPNPDLSYLWQLALGLVEPDFSQCEAV